MSVAEISVQTKPIARIITGPGDHAFTHILSGQPPYLEQPLEFFIQQLQPTESNYEIQAPAGRIYSAHLIITNKEVKDWFDWTLTAVLAPASWNANAELFDQFTIVELKSMIVKYSSWNLKGLVYTLN